MTNMPQATQQLEARLARVEMELAALKAALPSRNAQPWYRQVVGDFSGDKAYLEIMRLGRPLRSGKRKG
jgi:hypothetical protein